MKVSNYSFKDKRRSTWGSEILTPSISLKLLTKKSRLSLYALTISATVSPPAFPNPSAATPAFWAMLLAPDVSFEKKTQNQFSFYNREFFQKRGLERHKYVYIDTWPCNLLQAATICFGPARYPSLHPVIAKAFTCHMISKEFDR